MRCGAQPVYLTLALTIAQVVALGSAHADEPNAGTMGGRERAARVTAPKSAEHVELERLQRRTERTEKGKPVGNAFNAKRWYVPPPPRPPPAPPPPPPPTAPPVPFTYLGRYQDASKLVIMLARGDKLYTVSPGEVIDGTYRVDSISDSAVVLMYLPLNISQSVPTTPAPAPLQYRPGIGQFVRRP